MKKIFLAVLLIINVFCGINAENSIGIKTNIGNDILFAEKKNSFPYFSFSTESELNNICFNLGVLLPFHKYIEEQSFSDFETSIGLTSSIGYKFHFSFLDHFSIEPAFAMNQIHIQQSKYESDSLFQLGVKVNFDFYIPIKKVNVIIGFAPQYNFLNILESNKEKSKTLYEYNEKTGNYEKKEFVYSDYDKTIFSKSFQYEFSLGLSYKF